jgi:hypothetical protein
LAEAIDLETWRGSALPGERVTYHSGGYVARERTRSPEIERLASTAWELYMSGRVLLSQRKVSETVTDYIITACDARPVRRKN